MIKKIIATSLVAASILLTNGPSTYAIEGPVEAPAMEGMDITRSFSDKMLKNAAVIAYYAMTEKQKKNKTYPVYTGKYFASLVNSRGDWDYKHAYGTNIRYIYNGKYATGEGLGNLHYGYVGRAAGFSEDILKAAAGAVQIMCNTYDIGWYKSYFDDPRDQYWINYGVSLWGKKLPTSSPMYSSSGDEIIVEQPNLTEEQLVNLLTAEEMAMIEQQVTNDTEGLLE